MSAAIAKENNAGANSAMTGVMNALGQDGNFAASRLPIKNRINALDVSLSLNLPTYCTDSPPTNLINAFYHDNRETAKKP